MAPCDFIETQKVFFVATAAPEGRVNVAPKGMDTLRVLGPNRIVWLNLTGSENETASHLIESPRIDSDVVLVRGQNLDLASLRTREGLSSAVQLLE